MHMQYHYAACCLLGLLKSVLAQSPLNKSLSLPLFLELWACQNRLNESCTVNGWIRNHRSDQDFQLRRYSFGFFRIAADDSECTCTLTCKNQACHLCFKKSQSTQMHTV